MTITREDIFDAVLGSFDGVLSQLGVVIGAAITGHRTALFAASLGLIAAETVSMAGGDYLGSGSSHRALVMGAATLLGSLVVLLPFLVLPYSWAPEGCVAVCITAATFISYVRSQSVGWKRGVLQTFAILATAASLTTVVTLTLG
ncbi:MAG: hypothetical protein KGL39_52590 [Patescibacteria group bacterium]|nr:hypothetical protein [Patescibacteria group bacterium]